MRVPASYCGVYGMKPSYGMLSRWGVVSYADTLDTVGILARNIGDVRQVFNVLALEDERDATCIHEAMRLRLDAQVERILARIPSRLDGLRVGIVKEMYPREVDSRTLDIVDDVLDHMQSLGATLVPLSVPAIKKSVSAYYILSLSEASSNLGRFDGIRFGARMKHTSSTFHDEIAKNRSYGFGDEVKRRILLGTYALTSEAWESHHLVATRIRQGILRGYQACWSTQDLRWPEPTGNEEHGVDVVVQPTALSVAPRLDEPVSSEYAADVLTFAANLAGLPALSAPASRTISMDEDPSVHLPVGVLFKAQWGHDKLLFHILEQLNQHTDVFQGPRS